MKTVRLSVGATGGTRRKSAGRAGFPTTRWRSTAARSMPCGRCSIKPALTAAPSPRSGSATSGRPRCSGTATPACPPQMRSSGSAAARRISAGALRTAPGRSSRRRGSTYPRISRRQSGHGCSKTRRGFPEKGCAPARSIAGSSISSPAGSTLKPIIQTPPARSSSTLRRCGGMRRCARCSA